MKKGFLLILGLLCFLPLWATHQKAAEITFVHLSGYTYRFTLITYTFSESLADRPDLDIVWGYNNQYSTVPRSRVVAYPDIKTQENHYIVDHTFPGPGSYTISMTDANRNGGVINMNNSINTPMYVESKLIISPFLTPPNSSPQLLNKPIDEACLGIPFIHNPGAYDPDGDSLSYELINCRGAEGLDIPSYVLPKSSKSISIHPSTGDLRWDSPVEQGEFNLAILIKEHRMGVKIGEVVRDLQVTARVCNNRLPEIQAPEKVCVFAGDTLRIPITAIDPDTNDLLTLSATSGIFQGVDSLKAFFRGAKGRSPVRDTFFWAPKYSHVQTHVYPVYFRVIDNGSPKLSNSHTLLISVLAKAPQWTEVNASFKDISLDWTPLLDTSVLGYRLYRSSEPGSFVQEECSSGFNDSSYVLLREIKGFRSHHYVDTSQVQQGLRYCYRILALFQNGSVSQVSDSRCAELLSDHPILEKVSVSATHASQGKIDVQWRKPLDLPLHSQHVFVIHRAAGRGEYQAIDTLASTDTVFQDLSLNTLNNNYFYRIELLNKADDEHPSLGSSQASSSLFVNTQGKNQRVLLQWYDEQAWKNDRYVVYRKGPADQAFDSIALVYKTSFTDAAVINDSLYAYQIKALGQQYSERLPGLLINFSQIALGSPHLDTPCKPLLLLDFSDCNPPRNGISWQNDLDCSDDNLQYKIYFRAPKAPSFTEITTTSQTNFVHDELSTNAACYYVVSFNSKGLHSPSSDTLCTDYAQCQKIEFPNIFTPNDDGVNDIYRAFPHQYNGGFLLKIFNRWGGIVYESSDPNFEWDGKNQKTNAKCPEGAYFYVVRLKTLGMDSEEEVFLNGNITILR